MPLLIFEGGIGYGKETSGEFANELKKSGQNIRRIFTRTIPSNSNLDYYFMNRNTGKVTTMIIEYGFADSKKDDIRQLQSHWKKYAGFCLFSGNDYFLPSGTNEITPSKKEQVLHLPAPADSWRVYPLNKQPTKGNGVGFLRPAKFKGLKYEILEKPYPHVFSIKTRDFGTVNIYAHPNTGAIIK